MEESLESADRWVKSGYKDGLKPENEKWLKHWFGDAKTVLPRLKTLMSIYDT